MVSYCTCNSNPSGRRFPTSLSNRTGGTVFITRGFHKREIWSGSRSDLRLVVHPCWGRGQGLSLLMDYYWLGGTWRYSCSRSALIFCKCSSGEQAERESWNSQVIFSNIRNFFLFFFFCLCGTDLPWLTEIYMKGLAQQLLWTDCCKNSLLQLQQCFTLLIWQFT